MNHTNCQFRDKHTVGGIVFYKHAFLVSLYIFAYVYFQNHTWTAEASVLGNPKYGSLNGVLTATFNPATGQALFPDLNITGFGIFYIQFHVVSSPPDFDTTLNYKMNIMNPAHVGMVPEEEYEIQVLGCSF